MLFDSYVCRSRSAHSLVPQYGNMKKCEREPSRHYESLSTVCAIRLHASKVMWWVLSVFSNWSFPVSESLTYYYCHHQISELKQAWDKATPGQKFFIPICAINLAVFTLWRIPSMKRIMTQYFLSNPVGSESHYYWVAENPLTAIFKQLFFFIFCRNNLLAYVPLHIQSLFNVPHIDQHVCYVQFQQLMLPFVGHRANNCDVYVRRSVRQLDQLVG